MLAGHESLSPENDIFLVRDGFVLDRCFGHEARTGQLLDGSTLTAGNTYKAVFQLNSGRPLATTFGLVVERASLHR
jgi:hypothetical protein